MLPASDATLIVEAEELQVTSPGWRALPYGTNYYAATLANTFLSRQAYLGAPEQCEPTSATVDVQVPQAGRYLALVRYEAAYRFETRFRLRVEQKGRTKLDRLYGARQATKVWPFGKGLAEDVTFDWGSADEIVWEGVDAQVDLDAGPARVTLVADRQPEPAARRNVDVIVLTSDQAAVQQRLAHESYLPLDGILTQAGDVFLRVQNHGEAVALTIPPGREHSPYAVHLRDWKSKTVDVGARAETDWIECGSLLDTLNDGQWTVKASGKGPLSFDVDFGVRTPEGSIDTIRTMSDQTGDLALAYFGNTRYSRRLDTQDEVLDNLLKYLESRPAGGTSPARTLVYGYSFDPTGHDAAYQAKVSELVGLLGGNHFTQNFEPPSDFLDVRGIPTARLDEYCARARTKLDPTAVHVVSLGDEIGLPRPPADAQADFRKWLRQEHVQARDADPASGGDYGKVFYDTSASASKAKPALFYYSSLFSFRYGEQVLGERTAILHKCFPKAGIGANFSPHQGHLYLGDTHQWITPFRDGALTMPWSEDYIFQVPVASPQINELAVDILRAGVRGKEGARIQYYVMAHDPGNTPDAWRRQFYADLAHGVKIFNLYEMRPVQAAYTENHVDAPEMYGAVRTALHELGSFEDIVQDGHVPQARVALWFSEAADVWNDKQAPFDAHERALYLMLRHQQIPLDVVIEGDDLSGYDALYLTDRHVSQAASRAITAWVEHGGRLFATAGAGMFDEFDRPNALLRRLFGIVPGQLESDPQGTVRLEKQDLPFVRPMDHVRLAGADDAASVAVIAIRSPVVAEHAEVIGRFDDGRPAVTVKHTGKGSAKYLGFLPALSYLQPSIPRLPFDRRSDDGAMCHLLPTRFDDKAASALAPEVPPPVVVSEPLVEATIIESPEGIVVPLVNWSGRPVRGLSVVVRGHAPAGEASLASGGSVGRTTRDSETAFTVDLDAADALILR